MKLSVVITITIITSLLTVEPTKCQKSYDTLYSYSSDGKGPYFYRQENGKRINGLNRKKFKKIRFASLSFVNCLYQCTSIEQCYMGVFDLVKRECTFYDFVAPDSYLIDDANSITFFKGSNKQFCVI
jgi:hypothetical protein